jgi:hypothetical protein
MLRFARPALASACCLALALAAAGCRNRDDAARSDTQAAGGAVTTESALRVTEVDLGRAVGADNRVTDETDEFRPNDTIYASVITEGTANTAQLVARWTFQDGQVVDETSRQISPTGTAVTEFHISKPGGWPRGRYTLRILLDGREVQSKEFEVK